MNWSNVAKVEELPGPEVTLHTAISTRSVWGGDSSLDHTYFGIQSERERRLWNYITGPFFHQRWHY